MDLEKGVFKKKSAKGIAKSILRSVKRSRRKKGSTLSSGISMMTYYANRGRSESFDAAKEKDQGGQKRVPEAGCVKGIGRSQRFSFLRKEICGMLRHG